MVIDEELGFSKKIDKLDKCIDKIEIKNNNHLPKNDKQREYQDELKGVIKHLRSSSKELKKLNNYKGYKTKEEEQEAKKLMKKIIKDQKSFILKINDTGFLNFLKKIGVGTAIGAIIGGLVYLIDMGVNKAKDLFSSPETYTYLLSKAADICRKLGIENVIPYEMSSKNTWVMLDNYFPY